MANYILTYTGSSDLPDTEEGVAELMAAWNGWFSNIGAAVVDGGNPFGPSSTVAADGTVSTGGASGLTGYSVLTADSLAAAQELAKGCPVLAGGGAVEVYEVVEM